MAGVCVKVSYVGVCVCIGMFICVNMCKHMYMCMHMFCTCVFGYMCACASTYVC